MSGADQLDPAFVRRLMDELQQALAARNVDGRMFIVGGAALALRYPEDHTVRVTTDVDAVYWPETEVREEADKLAERYKLSKSWLNPNARPFVPDGQGSVHEPSVGFVIDIADPRVLVAMKLASAREQDMADLVILARHLRITTPEVLVDIAFDIYGEDSMGLPDSREDVLLLAIDVLEHAKRTS